MRQGAVRKLYFPSWFLMSLAGPVSSTEVISPSASSYDQKSTGSFHLLVWLKGQDKDKFGHPLDSVYNSWYPAP